LVPRSILLSYFIRAFSTTDFLIESGRLCPGRLLSQQADALPIGTIERPLIGHVREPVAAFGVTLRRGRTAADDRA
jgi:hypothetical protein